MTREVSSNQVAAKLLVVTASNVPIPDSPDFEELTFSRTV
jgi:hypothetical protein